MSKKILKHPDKKLIIEKLIKGESTREVESWLKEKYPDQSRLHITYMTLQKFRKDNLDLHGDVLEDIKTKRAEIVSEQTEEEKKELLLNSSAYRDKINQIADTELNVTKRMLELDAIIQTRLEYYYNILMSGGSFKEDKLFLEYINTMRSLLQDWKKYIEGFADKRVENNISVTIVNQQINILKTAISETLQELDPSYTNLFLDKLNDKIDEIQYEEQIRSLSVWYEN